MTSKSVYAPGDRVYIAIDVCDYPVDPVTLIASYLRRSKHGFQRWWKSAEGWRFTEECIVEKADA